MKIFTLTLLFGLLLISCDHEQDVKTLRKVFSETHYDTSVIQSLQLYQSLKDIIITHIDTIFKFRNARHFVFHTNGKDTATIREDANYYKFYYNYREATSLSYGTGPNNQKLIDEVNVENIPAFIYPSVDTIFRKLGKNKIRGFTLSTDSTIEISIKNFHKEKENVDVAHTLTWKRTYSINTDTDNFYRDTIIAPKWTYQIWVDEHYGW